MKKLIVAGVAIAALAACGGSPGKPDSLRMGSGDESDQVFMVAESSDETTVRTVVDKAVKYLDATAGDGGYFIEISCADGSVIGTARFALGDLGAAQVGLNEGDYDFKYASSDPTC